MDPVGPWSAAYAQYNRLSSGQPAQAGSDLHHHLAPSAASNLPPSTTAQILSAGFLSPNAYEGVFPLFHHANTKPTTHYINQQRQVLAQAAQAAQAVQAAQVQAAQAAAVKQSDGDYHNAQSFFEQNASAWQQNSPFGILPHESVMTPSNFNAHLAAQSIHLNNLAKNASQARQQTQQTSIVKPSASFYQASPTFPSNSDSSNSTNKTYASSPTAQSLQQTCIVSSNNESKDYRVSQPSASAGRAFSSSAVISPRIEKFVPPIVAAKQQPTPQIQTKAQTKIYPELANQIERRNNEEQSQSSVISFSISDSQRLSYNNASSSAPKRNFQGNYRQYQQGINTEADFQRSNANNSNSSECTVVVPRRPSPLQAHSQASPIGHAPSPVYPVYNSPMNSQLSSPQNPGQTTPAASPLDVSIPRSNAQSGNIGYPSVITRALTTPNQSQSCWDERRKFANYNTPGNSIEIPSRQIDIPNRTELPQRQAAALNIPERQQSFVEPNHQVTLQDLSSCRGDPMSLVKNLHQQQASCQVQQTAETKQSKVSKRRKSYDRAPPPNTEAPGRLPPPAHSSATNSNQQNGAYFDFDRWNLPAGTSKIFTPQSLPQHHQGLMHLHTHHSQPPLPYFPPFHIAGHPSEYQSVEIPSLQNSYNEQNAGQTPYQAEPEEQPKVVVPNIEEELNFLNESDLPVPPPAAQAQGQSKAGTSPGVAKPGGGGDAAKAGFLCSYIKFLQGERDSSPPHPSSRGVRKSYARKSQAGDPKVNANGLPAAGAQQQQVLPPLPTPTPPTPPARLTQGDPQDDPRYFPLPKERKGTLAPSDDGVSSDDEFFKKLPLVAKDVKDRKRPKSSHKKRSYKRRDRYNQEIPSQEVADLEMPRRETSKRAAKDKINMKAALKDNDDVIEEPPEFIDSDSDPAWTPAAKDENEDELAKKGKRGKPTAFKKKGFKNLISEAAQGAGIDYANSMKSSANALVPTLEDNIAAAVAKDNNVPVNGSPFKSGEFIGLKSEMHLHWPQELWRVDGVNLCKFEPFDQNGCRLYRIVPIYSSLTFENRNLYTPIQVRRRSQTNTELIVELIHNEIKIYDKEFVERSIKSNEVYQDNFEVYIQTLISQALDSNFLKEIFQEKDDYFLTNVKMIDDITVQKKNKLINSFCWPEPLQCALSIWPCFNIITEHLDTQHKTCIACHSLCVTARIILFGQPYNQITLEGCHPDTAFANEKDFMMCRVCTNRIDIFNKVAHQKYLMYLECAKRVSDKRIKEGQRDSTCILNELLADDAWLNQLFLCVRKYWAEVDSTEYSLMRQQQQAMQ